MKPDLHGHGHTAENVEELTAQNVKTVATLERKARDQATMSDRVASRITSFCGSMTFVWVHAVFFTAWIIYNTVLPFPRIDPYPFSFLTLMVSLEAIFLSAFIMVAENRQERIAERRNYLDLQINLLAEQENTKMLELLSKIAAKLGIDPSEDPSVKVLEQATHPERLAQQIDKSMEESENQKSKEPQ